jgi:spermidine synthase
MQKSFEELDFRNTPLGEISLRRRRIMQLGGQEVYEVKLGDEYLMSSLFHEVEVALADLGLQAVEGAELDVVVGGLGLGYTAVAALKDARVRSLCVVDKLAAVIEWHQQGLVPLGPTLTQDSRCRLIEGDFFDFAQPEKGFDPSAPGKLFHAILLDIDHSPKNLLHAKHGAFYSEQGLRALAQQLHPRGVFAMWSDDAPDADFMRDLETVFVECRSHVVKFHNPLLERDSESTVYVAVRNAE